jgi:hypothetical protein
MLYAYSHIRLTVCIVSDVSNIDINLVRIREDDMQRACNLKHGKYYHHRKTLLL